MGYTTEFKGKFNIDKQLSPNHKKYLEMFSDTRRMKRDPEKILKLSSTKPEKPGVCEGEPTIPRNQACLDLLKELSLDLGPDGAYYCGAGFAGQLHENSILDYNQPPIGQPGLWCQWVPTKNGKGIEWNGAEKFYNYVEWLEYLIKNFLKPWGYTLSGEVTWEGEDHSDTGIIIITKNVVRTYGIEEYKILKTSDRELPLLVGRLKTSEGKTCLAKRLRRV